MENSMESIMTALVRLDVDSLILNLVLDNKSFYFSHWRIHKTLSTVIL